MSRQVKVKVLSNSQVAYSRCLRDTTVGKVYDAVRYEAGEIKDIDGCPAIFEGFQLVDDVGEKVYAHERLGQLEIVEIVED